MREKIALVAFLVLAVSAAANVTLSYGECKSVENDSYCAPGEPALNLTSAYQSCIADSNARIDNLSAGLTVFSGLNASDLLACNADKEVAIALEKETRSELEQRSKELVDSLAGKINIEEFNALKNATESQKAEIAGMSYTLENEKRNMLGLGAILGAGAVYLYTSRNAKNEHGVRDGRAARTGA